jgi:hypothetical protein
MQVAHRSQSEIEWLPAVEFKLVDEVVLPHGEPPSLADLLPAGLGVHDPVLQLTPTPLLGASDLETLDRLIARARALNPDYHPPRFENHLRVKTRSIEAAHALADALRLNPLIQFARVQRMVPQPGMTPGDDTFSSLQQQIKAPPDGVNALGAWARGATGEGIQIVDLEHGYEPHEDLAGVTLVHTTDAAPSTLSPHHGTAVLGILGASDNTLGVIGLAPGASLGFAQRYGTTTSDDRLGSALTAALDHLKYGDILLIEQQEYAPGDGGYVGPIELNEVLQEFLPLIRSLGVVLVEPSGNGSSNIDTWLTSDSGAIIVGGVSPATLKRDDASYLSNYGSRVNCHALYDGVVTTGWDADLAGAQHANDAYTKSFYGTSATAAIVAGAAALVQSYAAAKLGFRLDPETMRHTLVDSGVPSADPPNDQVGTMPNVLAAVTRLQFVNNPIIPNRPGVEGPSRTPWGDPDGIRTEFFDPLHPLPLPPPVPLPGPAPDPVAGLRVRVTARTPIGAPPATDVRAHVYVSPPSFLPPMDKWRNAGRLSFGNIEGNGATREALLPRPLDADTLVQWGGCSIVAILGFQGWKAPGPHAIEGLAGLEKFLSSYPGVAVLTRLLPRSDRLNPLAFEREQWFEFRITPPPPPARRAVLVLAHRWIGANVTLEMRRLGGGAASGASVTHDIPIGPPVRIPVELPSYSVVACRLRCRAVTGHLPRERFVAALELDQKPWSVMTGETFA